MTHLLAGKVAIVTGGGRGLGRAHALALAAAGAAVLVNDLGGPVTGEVPEAGDDPAERVAQEIEARQGRAISDTHDISDWEGARALVEAAVGAFGRLDIVVNNAGIVQFRTIVQETAENWARTLAVNLGGTAALTHWAARYWRQLGPEAGRSIINTSSPAGTNPLSGCAAYCASKAGVAALTISSAAELADLGVRVNAIAPIARTRLIDDVPAFDEHVVAPATGFDKLSPKHAAQVVTYLASPLCSLTGRVVGVDGDDLYLFNGFSAEGHWNNGGSDWAPESLAAALSGADPRDRALIIAPSTYVRVPQPSDEVLSALAAVRRGEAVTLTPLLYKQQ